MVGQSKRTTAPTPLEFPWTTAQHVPPPTAQSVPPPTAVVPPPSIPSMFVPGTWLPPHPPRSMAASTPMCWPLPVGVHQPSMGGSSAQGPWWIPPAGMGGSGQATPTPGNFEDYDLQACFFKNTSRHAQAVSNGTSKQPINVGDDTNGGDCARTEKLLPWTKEEDLRLVSVWLNNSNDPIQSNYKKNEQYWKGVAAVYNSTTPKSRARKYKQVKDHFGKIKKEVAWFCASCKEAEALYASGESDVDLKKRAIQTYEADHKEDGPFMFEHCWEVLKEEPKWAAYLERLEDLEPDKRKYSVDDEVGQHFTLNNAQDERPIGGKQAKELRKRKRKDQGCIIDLEDELNKFVDAQNAANEGRKEMLETQKRVSSENLEARRLACLAAKDHKESVKGHFPPKCVLVFGINTSDITVC